MSGYISRVEEINLSQKRTLCFVKNLGGKIYEAFFLLNRTLPSIRKGGTSQLQPQNFCLYLASTDFHCIKFFRRFSKHWHHQDVCIS